MRIRPRLGGCPETAATVPEVRRRRQPRKPGNGATHQPRHAGIAELDPNTRPRAPKGLSPNS